MRHYFSRTFLKLFSIEKFEYLKLQVWNFLVFLTMSWYNQIPQQTFLGLQDVLKMSSTGIQRNTFLSSKTKNCYAENVLKIRILLLLFCFHFLRTHHNYFFRRGFESVWTQTFSRIISEKECYFYFTCLITIHLSLHSSCWIWHLIIVIRNRRIVWKVVWIEYHLWLNLSYQRYSYPGYPSVHQM